LLKAADFLKAVMAGILHPAICKFSL